MLDNAFWKKETRKYLVDVVLVCYFVSFKSTYSHCNSSFILFMHVRHHYVKFPVLSLKPPINVHKTCHMRCQYATTNLQYWHLLSLRMLILKFLQVLLIWFSHIHRCPHCWIPQVHFIIYFSSPAILSMGTLSLPSFVSWWDTKVLERHWAYGW